MPFLSCMLIVWRVQTFPHLTQKYNALNNRCWSSGIHHIDPYCNSAPKQGNNTYYVMFVTNVNWAFWHLHKHCKTWSALTAILINVYSQSIVLKIISLFEVKCGHLWRGHELCTSIKMSFSFCLFTLSVSLQCLQCLPRLEIGLDGRWQSGHIGDVQRSQSLTQSFQVLYWGYNIISWS